MGFNTVSIYVMWALIEPKKGEVSFEGYRDLQPFFDAAMEAGLYVIARPGCLIFLIQLSPNSRLTDLQTLHQRRDYGWRIPRLGNIYSRSVAYFQRHYCRSLAGLCSGCWQFNCKEPD